MSRIFLLVLLVAVSFTAAAQETSKSEPQEIDTRFHGGVMIGATASQIDGDGFDGFNKLGFLGGAYVNMPIRGRLRLQAEMQYVNKGSRQPPDPDNGNSYWQQMSLGYVEVPVLLSYQIRNLTYELGPSFGVLVRDKEEDVSGDRIGSARLFSFHSTEVAMHLGAGYEVLDNLSLFARYSHSVLPVSETTQFDTRWGLTGGAYNFLISFSARYRLIR